MIHIKKILAFRVSRFVLVGVANTAINFAILNLAFYGLHQTKLTSSFIATGCAVIFSFIMNRNFVFQDKSRSMQKLALFIILTASGVMLVQNSIYALGILLFHGHTLGISNVIHGLIRIRLSDTFIDVNLSNLVASLGVMVWNYNGYRLFVFKGERHGNDVIETETT
ncbi:MAG TPA: GtrA family protein [Patescibacteria group bacterium]|nr:GtrA family protein [Patescibacteria group bacterium]